MMKKQPAQWLLSAASVGIAGIILTQTYGTAVAETNTGSFVQTPRAKGYNPSSSGFAGP